MQDGRLAGMMIMLAYAVHRIVRRGSKLVHSDNGAVTNGAAIVPGHAGADGNGFERLFGRCHLYARWLHDLNSFARPYAAHRPPSIRCFIACSIARVSRR